MSAPQGGFSFGQWSSLLSFPVHLFNMTATLCNHTCDAYPRLFQFIRVHCKFSLFSFSFCTEGINQNNTYSITCILIAFLLQVFRYAIQYNSFALNSKCLTPLDVFDAPLDFWVTEFDKQRVNDINYWHWQGFVQGMSMRTKVYEQRDRIFARARQALLAMRHYTLFKSMSLSWSHFSNSVLQQT